MRKLTALLCLSWLCLLPLCAASSLPTSDRITLSTLTLNPGGEEGILYVNLEGAASEEQKYTAYNFDLHFPDGISVSYIDGEPDVMMEKGASGIYPYTVKRGEYIYTHTLSYSYNSVGNNVLRVSCYSTSNQPLNSRSGCLLSICVRAASYACPGDYKITIDGVAWS